MRKLLTLACGVACVLSFSGCGEGGEDDRGLRYMPDMYDSPALKSQEVFEVEDKDAEGNITVRHVSAMQQPVEGTIPRGFLPYDFAIDDTSGYALLNPLQKTAEILRLGRDKYNQFCAVCHGKDGNAENGYVASKFLGIPSLSTPLVEGYPDGQVHHIIAAGRGRMPNYRGQMTAEERWAVVHYVRALKIATDRGELTPTEEGQSFAPLREPLPEYLRGLWPSDMDKESH